MRLVSRPFPLATMVVTATANSVTAHTLGVLRSMITTTRSLAYSAINGAVWTRSYAASIEGCQFVVFAIRAARTSAERKSGLSSKPAVRRAKNIKKY